MPSLRASLFSGVFYTAIAKYTNVIFSIIISAVLARLLTPHEFGIVALVAVFVTFFNIIGDFGIGKAVIQNQLLSEYDIKSIFSFSVLIAIAFGLLFYLCGPFIAKFYSESELNKIAKLLSLSVFFHSLQAVPKALLQKELRFKQLGIISVIIQLATGIIAIILAYNDFSYYSLVIRSIINGILLFVIMYFMIPIKIALIINWNSVNKILGFSFYSFGFNFVNHFTRNGDNLLIGKFLGATSLGYYSKAYQLMMLPVSNLTNVLKPAMLPIFSKHQDDLNIIYSNYLKVIKVLSIIGFPLTVFLFFSASEIVTVVYGNQWGETILVFEVLSILIGIQILYSSAGSIFLAINRPKILFYFGLISSFILLIGISLGLYLGQSILAVSYGIVSAFIINFFLIFYLLVRVALKKSLILFFKELIVPIIVSLVTIIIFIIIPVQEVQNVVLSLILKAFISTLILLVFLYCVKGYRQIFYLGIKQYIQRQ